MNYNVIAIVYHDIHSRWHVERYSMPGPQYDLLGKSKKKGNAKATPFINDRTIGVYLEQSNHFPERFDGRLDALNRVLARTGETFGGTWLVVKKSMGSWIVWEAKENYLHNEVPSWESFGEAADKKTDAVDIAKGIVVRQDRPGVIIYKANDEPQKVKIWGSRFWSKLGDRVRGNMKSSQARAFKDAQDQL